MLALAAPQQAIAGTLKALHGGAKAGSSSLFGRTGGTGPGLSIHFERTCVPKQARTALLSSAPATPAQAQMGYLGPVSPVSLAVSSVSLAVSSVSLAASSVSLAGTLL